MYHMCKTWLQKVHGGWEIGGVILNKNITRKPYGFMQSSFWVIMMVHVMVCGDL